MSALATVRQREPVIVRFAALAVVVVLNHFVHVGPNAELLINLAALALFGWLTRRRVTPSKPIPSPAVQPVQIPKEPTMNEFEQWLADLAAKAETALSALAAFNQAHPEIASVEADALTAGVTDLATTAKSAVAANVPALAQPTADVIVAAIQAKAESDIAAIQANASTAKAAVTAALPAA